MEYSLSVATVKTKLNLALTKAEVGIQALVDKEKSIVYNEDHLQEMADLINAYKKATKILSNAKKEIKSPYSDIINNIDSSYNEISSLINEPFDRVTNGYNKLCHEIAERKRLADAAKEREDMLRNGVTTAIAGYSLGISESKTIDRILEVERLLNLECANEGKYKEFLPLFKMQAEALRPLIRQRKEAIKEISIANKEEFEAIATDADDRLESALDAKQIAEHKLHESSIRIQEAALSGTMAASETYQVITTEAPKPRRTEWRWEVTDFELFKKRYPQFVKSEPDSVRLKLHVNALKDTGQIKEETKDGLRVYKEVKY